MDENEPGLYLGRYRKVKLIKKTQNKEIWEAKNRHFGEKVVLKLQPHSQLQKTAQRNVLNEASYMQGIQGHIGIPFMIWSGVQQPDIVVIVEMLGASIEERFAECDNKFSLKTVCMLGLQLMNIIQNFHEKNLVHRNISLKNFQFGKAHKCCSLFFNDLIDCKRYRNKRTQTHCEEKKNTHTNQNIFWTASHYESKQLSRKHDVESILLMLIYLLKGSLPWQKQFEMKTYNQVKNEGFQDIQLICEGIPKAFEQMLEKIRKTDFKEEPAYIWYKKKLECLFISYGLKRDGIYDWMLTKKHQNKLVVKNVIPSLKLYRDAYILRQLYEPYQQPIDIDEVNTKYLKTHGFKEDDSRGNQIMGQMQAKMKKRRKTKNGCEVM